MAELDPKALEAALQAAADVHGGYMNATKVRAFKAGLTAYLEASSPQEAAPGAVGVNAELLHALEIGHMGAPYHDYQGDLYMFERYKSDTYRDAEFRDYGLAHAVCVLLNNIPTIRSALTVLPSGQNETGGEVWHSDLTNVPRDRDFLIQFDHGEVTVGHYLDNSKTAWPWEGIRPARSMRPARVTEKIIAWREMPRPTSEVDAVPTSDILHPPADWEKSATPASGERNAVVEAVDLLARFGEHQDWTVKYDPLMGYWMVGVPFPDSNRMRVLTHAPDIKTAVDRALKETPNA